MIKVTGHIENIIFRNEDNYWTVFNLKTNIDSYTVVGTMLTADVGLKINAVLEENYNKKYGKQFDLISYELDMPTDCDAIVSILSLNDFKGIGPVLANRIVDNFGEDTFDVILNSSHELMNIKGMTKNRIETLKNTLMSKQSEMSIFLFLKKNGFGIKNIKKIYKVFGNETIDILKSNPYILIDKISGIGFNICDKLATEFGMDLNSDLRINSAIVYILRNNYFNGNVFLYQNELIEQLNDLLNIDIETEIENYLSNLQLKNIIKIITNDESILKIYLYKSYFIESNLSKMLFKIKDNINIITGGPGTGKTYNINIIIDNANVEGKKVICCAPTGRAAKRMYEVTKHEASTIHRTLELNPKKTDLEFGDDNNGIIFNKNENNKLDCDILIVDEASMVDQYLMYNLIKAVDNYTIVYFVGDVDQLPSVGPGNVLQDMINSNIFNVKVLNKIYRQSIDSHIPEYSKYIKNGLYDDLKFDYDDFRFVETNVDDNINKNIVKLVTNNIPKYFNIDIDKLQVICVTKKGNCGTDNLNKILQNAINPFSYDSNEIKFGDKIFRLNDKVMQVVNNYMVEYNSYDENGLIIDSGFGVFNGDIGYIISINKINNSIKIKFDEKIVEYFIDEFDNITLAYAITVHKSQGSEYNVVVMPITYAAHQLLNRKILYTAVTRAKDSICFVGNLDILKKMIENKYETKRNSSLCEKFYIS